MVYDNWKDAKQNESYSSQAAKRKVVDGRSEERHTLSWRDLMVKYFPLFSDSGGCATARNPLLHIRHVVVAAEALHHLMVMQISM